MGLPEDDWDETAARILARAADGLNEVLDPRASTVQVRLRLRSAARALLPRRSAGSGPMAVVSQEPDGPTVIDLF